ncbi:MAG: DUF3375 domain-containing protein [Succinivibrionaceae bacterium]|nr:DUF3375 domain-containing protein [Succinivibrionaceae bacterium]
MDFLFDYQRLRDLRESNPTLRLLRADNAPLVIAFLRNIFGREREVSYESASALLKEFLQELRDAGLIDGSKASARDYLAQWVDARWIRDIAGKQLLLTDAAQRAIEIAERMDEEVVSTSATHLEVLIQSVSSLYLAVCSNKQERVKKLRERIAVLERQIRSIASGSEAGLSEAQKRERILAVYEFAKSLPRDFRRLEEEIIDLDRQLRERMIRSDATKGEILASDLDAEAAQYETDYGAAYQGFFALLCDGETRRKFKDELGYVLNSEVAVHLGAEQREFLGSIIDQLVMESDRVRAVRARINANLRAYLTSDAFRESRRVLGLITALEQEAIKFKERGVRMLRGTPLLGFETGILRVRSLGALGEGIRLPVTDNPLASIEEHETTGELSADELRRLDKVRLSEVRESIRRTLGQASVMSVGEIIGRNQIRYGLEEVVAYVRIARELNPLEADAEEEIVVRVPRSAGEGAPGPADGYKRLRVRLPRIMLSSQMARDHR